jgi:hypothetical protein
MQIACTWLVLLLPLLADIAVCCTCSVDQLFKPLLAALLAAAAAAVVGGGGS